MFKEIAFAFGLSLLTSLIAIALFFFILYEWSQGMENKSQWAIIAEQRIEIERLKAVQRPLVAVTGPSSYIAVSREEIVILENTSD